MNSQLPNKEILMGTWQLELFLFYQGDLQNLEDASDDLLMVDDESVPIAFVVGEVFVHFNMEETKVIILTPI